MRKVRPAVIISEPTRVKEHVIVAFITSKLTPAASKSWITVTQRSKESGESGLKQASLIRCDKIASLDKKIVLGEIGKLPTVMKKVDSALRFTLGLRLKNTTLRLGQQSGLAQGGFVSATVR